MDDFSDYELRCIEREDLAAATVEFQHRTGCPRIEAQRAVFAKHREVFKLPEPTEMYVGYHEDRELPIKPGDTVTIRKGVMVKNLHHGTKAAGRTYKVKVDHLLPGTTRYRNHRGEVNDVVRNPSVRWAGKGGYWSEVDINLIPEACPNCSGIGSESCILTNCPGKTAP